MVVEEVEKGEEIVVVAAASEYHKTVFPEPPLTVFSKEVKLKLAVPLPSSQSDVEVPKAVGKLSTVKSIATGSEAQFASPTTA